MSSEGRARASARGRFAEDSVSAFLQNSGYAVIGRNVRVGHLEVDIVARKGSVIAVVEVRHRGPSSWQSAFESISETKQQRLRRAADRLWRERFVHDSSIERIRFDVASVSFDEGQPNVDYIEGAF